MDASNPSAHSFSVLYYTENETVDVESLKDGWDPAIATDLVTRFNWRKFKRENMDVTRLKGQLLIDDSKYWLLSGNDLSKSLQSRPLLYWGSLVIEKLIRVLSKIGINGSIKERDMSGTEPESVGIIQIHDPGKALMEVGATSTSVGAPDENLAARIFEAITTLLDGI